MILDPDEPPSPFYKMVSQFCRNNGSYVSVSNGPMFLVNPEKLLDHQQNLASAGPKQLKQTHRDFLFSFDRSPHPTVDDICRPIFPDTWLSTSAPTTFQVPVFQEAGSQPLVK